MSHHNETRICHVCGRELKQLPLQSPVVADVLWSQLLETYGLSENRIGPNRTSPKPPAQNPVYICTDCMEKALGRELYLSDIKNVPFNMFFKLLYFYRVPRQTVLNIRTYLNKMLKDSANTFPGELQRRVDFMNAVLMPFIDPKCSCEIPCNEQNIIHKLSMFSDEQLKTELKRRAEQQK